MGLIPGQGTEIPQVSQPEKRKKIAFVGALSYERWVPPTSGLLNSRTRKERLNSVQGSASR